MLNATATQVNVISAKANAMVNEAKQLAANTAQIATQAGLNTAVQLQIQEAQQKVQTTIDQIEVVKSQLLEGRKLAQEKLDEVRRTISQAQVQVDGTMAQIKAKESNIQQLSQQVVSLAVWPFGEVSTPDPAALAEMSVLQVEVAALYAALATAKNIVATTQQAEISISTQISHVPLEANPRLTELYMGLDAAKTALSVLKEKAATTAETAFQSVLTTENKRKIVAIASQKIHTDLPNEVEADLFLDAIGKVEAILAEAIPARALHLMQWPGQGLTGETSQFIERLTEKVNQSVDILMLDEAQEAVFFSLLINILTDAMQAGHTLDQLLAAV